MRWLALVLALVAGPMAAAADARPLAIGQAAVQTVAPPELATLKSAYDRDPTDTRAAIEYVAGALRAGQPALARPVLYALLSRPASLPASVAAEAWFQMGHVHLSAQEYEEAVACWDTVVRDHRGSDRASGAAINAASVLLQVLGDPDRAYGRLTASLRDRTIAGPHLELANFLLFQIYVERHDYTNARGLLASLPGSGPRHDLIQDVIPVVLWKTGDEAVARRQIESLFTGAADDASALNNLAGTLASHGVALDTAIAAAARAIVLSDTRHDIWDTYAEALFRSGQIEKAIDAEEKAIVLATAQKDQAEYRARLARFKAARKPPAPGRLTP
jgi:tetratricopeptide (TPR) repeat protein